jgi:hypothetical protein
LLEALIVALNLWGEQEMARHELTKEECCRGIRKALKNPRTPKHFKAALRKRLRTLEGK